MADKLKAYRGKRDFKATAEPAGDGGADGAPEVARFVVQEHHARRLHWDLRLEHDGVLASWAIPNGISEDPKENRKAVHTEDHPLEYIDFEGEIPKGEYGAGTMKVWDSGTYECHKFSGDEVMVTFHGERLEGRYVLFRAGQDPKDWMIHRMDPPADAEREPMPERIVPMLAKLGDLPRDQSAYGFEIKWDGIRALVYSQPGRLHIEGRRLTDITERYPELRPLNRALSSHSAVLDGEIVVFDSDGKPSFELLQQRMHLSGESRIKRRAKEIPASYMAFDLLYMDGHSLMGQPYEERRERLEALELEGPAWRTPAYHRGEGTALLKATVEQGLEGVMAKRLDSRYEPGSRNGNWAKVKNKRGDVLLIGGWVPGQGKRESRVGALLVGQRDDEGSLRYAGRVGTGFKERDLDRFEKLLEPLRRKTSPFMAGPKPPRGALFCKPELSCRVEFTERTSEGLLRHPVYKGLVDAEPSIGPLRKLSGKGVEATVEGRTLRLTNLDKVLYPAVGFTKGQVIDYYTRIAPVLLPHLQGRPLTMKRYPDGVDGKFFYEKQCPSHRPDWVKTEAVWSRHNKANIDFCLADDLPTLVWAANLADLELHTSLSLAADIERPTMMVFDLDPGEPADIVDCCQVGVWVRELFDGLGMQCFPKTSGSKGLQVYVPMNVDTSYAQTKPFARAVAELLEKQHPELVVSRMTKSIRGGKVLVDWSQNDEHKTTICVYSLRARERPTVSTPVAWDEVERCLKERDAGVLTVDSGQALSRAEELGDLHAPVLTLQQELPALGN